MVIGMFRRSSLAFVVAGGDAWQPPLCHLAAAWSGLALSRLTGFFHLAGYLGYEFEDTVFGVARLDRGGFAVS